MRYILLLPVFALLIIAGDARAQKKIGPKQQKMLDSLCDCISKLDFGKISNSDDANKAFMNCFASHADQLIEVAEEEGVDLTSDDNSSALGEMIGKNLMLQKCGSFMKLAILMDDEEEEVELQKTTGVFKRIDNKGFNYVVIAENGSEKSFIWLEQFPDSEKFMNAGSLPNGKKLSITWKELEVYLPAAKGYYKVKEIKGIEVL
ncbi:hypothetical protein LT679_14790 [Mucilaginibacter roseus]|uniref:Uncharacterized protein n=1 Tax=Mucilaginibacter roseus TaxID=1528868 RepID=A0ABS8U434_9SPHI|nr:hypothetical protein [Mucilaginibacter roseus]MCD8741880.1 hypothetical protein [Mucilaginibacter roseus]